MRCACYDVCMKPETENVMAIDPSTKALGWAVFCVDHVNECAEMLGSGGIGSNCGDWVGNIDFMTVAVWELICKWDVDRAVIELPQHFGSARGTVAGNSSAILKLMACVFSLRQALLEGCVTVELVTVSQWKGQTPKRITQKRVRKHWGWRGEDHNEADAVGIGDWYVRKSLKFVPRLTH